jgi:hypothetical protein
VCTGAGAVRGCCRSASTPAPAALQAAPRCSPRAVRPSTPPLNSCRARGSHSAASLLPCCHRSCRHPGTAPAARAAQVHPQQAQQQHHPHAAVHARAAAPQLAEQHQQQPAGRTVQRRPQLGAGDGQRGRGHGLGWVPWLGCPDGLAAGLAAGVAAGWWHGARGERATARLQLAGGLCPCAPACQHLPPTLAHLPPWRTSHPGTTLCCTADSDDSDGGDADYMADEKRPARGSSQGQLSSADISEAMLREVGGRAGAAGAAGALDLVVRGKRRRAGPAQRQQRLGRAVARLLRSHTRGSWGWRGAWGPAPHQRL